MKVFACFPGFFNLREYPLPLQSKHHSLPIKKCVSEQSAAIRSPSSPSPVTKTSKPMKVHNNIHDPTAGFWLSAIEITAGNTAGDGEETLPIYFCRLWNTSQVEIFEDWEMERIGRLGD